MNSPLHLSTVFYIGPIPVTGPVIVTWAIIALLVFCAVIVSCNLRQHPSRFQAALELAVAALDQQIRDVLRCDPAPYRGFIGTLFVFILVANWSSLVPGVEPPTAHLETDAALALLVFLAAIWFGIRANGISGYLRTFLQPTVFMLPLNVAEAFTRTFSMSVRLFGNVMSGVFIIGIVLSLAGLLVPIPLMALDLLTGAIQAYIFTVLSIVFIGTALAGELNDKKSGDCA